MGVTLALLHPGDLAAKVDPAFIPTPRWRAANKIHPPGIGHDSLGRHGPERPQREACKSIYAVRKQSAERSTTVSSQRLPTLEV